MAKRKYHSSIEGKIDFINDIVEPWLGELGYHNIEYCYDNGNEYVLLKDENNKSYHIDITADSIEAIVVDVSRWIVEVHQKNI